MLASTEASLGNNIFIFCKKQETCPKPECNQELIGQLLRKTEEKQTCETMFWLLVC